VLRRDVHARAHPDNAARVRGVRRQKEIVSADRAVHRVTVGNRDHAVTASANVDLLDVLALDLGSRFQTGLGIVRSEVATVLVVLGYRSLSAA